MELWRPALEALLEERLAAGTRSEALAQNRLSRRQSSGPVADFQNLHPVATGAGARQAPIGVKQEAGGRRSSPAQGAAAARSFSRRRNVPALLQRVGGHWPPRRCPRWP